MLFSSYHVKNVCVLRHFSHVWLFETLWPVACQAPSSVHGILQARIPEWVAMLFPRGSSQPSDQTSALTGGFFPTSATWETPYKEYILSTWLIVDVNFDHLAEVVVVKFLHCRVTPPHPTLCSLAEVTMHSPHLRNEELCSTSLRVEFLRQIFWMSQKVCLFFPTYSFIQPFLSIWTHGYLLYTLGYKSKLFRCSKYFNFGLWEHFQVAYVSLWHILVVVGFFLFVFEQFLTFWHHATGSFYIFPAPVLASTVFSEEPWLLLLENGIGNQDLGPWCARCFRTSRIKRYMYVC